MSGDETHNRPEGASLNRQGDGRFTSKKERKEERLAKKKNAGDYADADEWDNMFERLVRYKQVNGDCRVPLTYRHDRALAGWVSDLRKHQKCIKGSRKTRLSAIGFVWNELERRWNDMFANLVKFKEDHGHCAVPITSKKYAELGLWVRVQRRQLNVRNKMDSRRKERLDSIGFCWDATKLAAKRDTDTRKKIVENDDLSVSDPDSINYSDTETEDDALPNKPWAHWKPPKKEETAHEETPAVKPIFPVGSKVRKFFNGDGWLVGEITSFDGENYRVKYKNCDSEDYDEAQVEKIMLTPELANVEVGSRVAVYWSDDERFYKATVTQERDKKRPWHLEYDDGECEWINLGTHEFRLLKERTRSRSPDEVIEDESDEGSEDDENGDSDAEDERPSAKRRRVSGRVQVKEEDDYHDDGGVLSKSETVRDQEKRATPNGSIVPRHTPRKNSDGTFARPPGRPPHGFVWDTSRGVYIPQSYGIRKQETVLSTDAGSVVIGSRVSVHWPNNGKFYRATVTRLRTGKKPFCVEYEDDSWEWIDLHKRKFRLLDGKA